MKNLKKRIFAVFMAALMCLGTSVTAFAADTEDTTGATCYNLAVSSDGMVTCTDENGNELSNVSPLSSISGYTSGSVTKDKNLIVLYPDNSSGIGGMGITVKASSSWNGNMKLAVGAQYTNSGVSTVFKDKTVKSNGETYFNNLLHRSPGYLVFVFNGIPSGKTVNLQIWVYG